MTLSEVRRQLKDLNAIEIRLPDGSRIPTHFHLTEVGRVEKQFMDCGGKLRRENNISLQLLVANDFDHRLSPEKFDRILHQATEVLHLGEEEVLVEYQGLSLETYSLAFADGQFELKPVYTACLAPSSCGLPKQKVRLSDLAAAKPACTPDSGCC